MLKVMCVLVLGLFPPLLHFSRRFKPTLCHCHFPRVWFWKNIKCFHSSFFCTIGFIVQCMSVLIPELLCLCVSCSSLKHAEAETVKRMPCLSSFLTRNKGRGVFDTVRCVLVPYSLSITLFWSGVLNGSLRTALNF